MGTGFARLKVLVLADQEADLRVAHTFASEPGVSEVAVLGKARSASLRTVTDPTGFDLVVSYGPQAFAVATDIGAAALSATELDMSPVPAVVGASLFGLGMAMAAKLEAAGNKVDRMATAWPGGTSGSQQFDFPQPVGRVSGTVLTDSPLQVVEAEAPVGYAAITVESGSLKQGVVDDHRFLAAIALGAGIALIPPAGIVRVWDSPATYLARAEAMGLVAASRL